MPMVGFADLDESVRVAACLTHRLRLVGRVLCHHIPIAAQILIMATVAGRIVDMKTL